MSTNDPRAKDTVSMGRSNGMLPRRSDLQLEPGPKIIPTRQNEQAIEVLGSHTARRIVAALQEEPRTASDVARAVGVTIQQCAYHLDNLRAANVIAPVDTWISAKGREMTVYAATGDPLMIAIGERPDPDTHIEYAIRDDRDAPHGDA